MRDVGRCAGLTHCGVSACVSVQLQSPLESGGVHALYCTNDCQYSHATRRKLKLKTANHPQREISRMLGNPACVSKSV
jgi:hypothetical protein